MNVIDRAANLLYSAEGYQATNVKFLCAGENSGFTAEDLAQQILAADEHVRNGTAIEIHRAVKSA